MLKVQRQLGDARCEIVFTELSDGNFGGEMGDASLPCDAVAVTLTQVHGTDVVTVDRPVDRPVDQPVDQVADRAVVPFATADAAVTVWPDLALTVRTADCVPVVLYSLPIAPDVAGRNATGPDDGPPTSAVGAVHAGWRGLTSGILRAAAAKLAEVAGVPSAIWAVVGPHISAASYEFGDAELAGLERRYGSGVRSRTNWGTPSLNLYAVLAAELDAADVKLDAVVGGCTYNEAHRWFSHRRGCTGRMATAVTLRAPRHTTA